MCYLMFVANLLNCHVHECDCHLMIHDAIMASVKIHE